MLKVHFSKIAAGADALAVGLRPGTPDLQFQPSARVPGLQQALALKHRFKAEEGDVLPVLTPQGWVVAVGLDAEDDQDAAALRRIGSALFSELCDGGIEELAVALDLSDDDAAEVAYGMMLRAWKPSPRYRSKPDPEDQWSLTAVTIVTKDPDAARKQFKNLRALAESVAFARDLVVAPANELTPTVFANKLEDLFPLGVKVGILDAKALAKQGLNLLLAVGKGSVHQPLLAILRWNGGKKKDPPLAFVGKGITFDTGGICIKDDEDMDEMKGDMGGAATVAGLIRSLAVRKVPVNAVGVLAIAENMVSGRANRPGDVLTACDGRTVEVVDTDAEGRLVLADALAWTAKNCKPSMMVDLATLTGAVEVAFGKIRAGLFCSDDALSKELFDAGEEEEELLWPLPLTDVYDDDLKSEIADIRSCSWDDLAPDHLHAARFLQGFVPDDLPWAHLDIAGTSEAGEDEDGEEPMTGPGPTGFGIRLLSRLIDQRLQLARDEDED